MRSEAFAQTWGLAGPAMIATGAVLVALSLFSILPWGGGRTVQPTAPQQAAAPALASGAVSFWEARVAADPADFIAYRKLGAAYLGRARETGNIGDYGRAQTAVDASLARLPGDNYPAYVLLGSLQNVRHEFAAAVETARAAIAIDPADPGAWAILGDAQVGLGLYDAAFETYGHLVALSPGLSSFARMAHIYELRGDLRNARAAWENAFSLDSGGNAEATAWARVQYGLFYFNQGELASAHEQVAAASDVFPGYVHAEAMEARLEAAEGRFDSAAALLGPLVARQPRLDYVVALGDIYAASGQTAEAQRQYDLVAAIGQLYAANGIQADSEMALFLADHDLRAEDAVEQALAVWRKQPLNVYSNDAVAWALHKAGRSREAVPYVEQALRVGVQDAVLHYHAGMVYAALDDNALAREHLSRALEINPYFSPLQAPIARSTLEELGP